MAYQDTLSFLQDKKGSWGGVDGSYIAYGMLNAVFQMIFYLAPSKVEAMQLINMSLENYLSDGTEEYNPEDEYEKNKIEREENE